MKPKIAKFVKTYRVLIADRRISSTELKVLLYLMDLAGSDSYCFPSEKTIGRDCGISDRQARKVVYRLQEVGHIKIQQHAFHSKSGKPLSGTHNGYLIAKITDVYGDVLPFAKWKELCIASEIRKPSKQKNSSSNRNEVSAPNRNTEAEPKRKKSSLEVDLREKDLNGIISKETTPIAGDVYLCSKNSFQSKRQAPSKEDLEIEILARVYINLIEDKLSSRPEPSDIDRKHCSEFLKKIGTRDLSCFSCLEVGLIVLGYSVTNWTELVLQHRKLAGFPSMRMFQSGWFDVLRNSAMDFDLYEISSLISELRDLVNLDDDLPYFVECYLREYGMESKNWLILERQEHLDLLESPSQDSDVQKYDTYELSSARSK